MRTRQVWIGSECVTLEQYEPGCYRFYLGLSVNGFALKHGKMWVALIHRDNSNVPCGNYYTLKDAVIAIKARDIP